MLSTPMPFGKYKGWPLWDVPGDYLLWVLRECARLRPGLRLDIQAELRSRVAAAGPETPPPGNTLALTSALIRTWHREMVLRYHPDRGGSHEAMQAINDAHDRLKELAGV
jgi:hypothetical protein